MHDVKIEDLYAEIEAREELHFQHIESLKNRMCILSAEKYELQRQLKQKDMFIDKLQADISSLKLERKTVLSHMAFNMHLEDLEGL